MPGQVSQSVKFTEHFGKPPPKHKVKGGPLPGVGDPYPPKGGTKRGPLGVPNTQGAPFLLRIKKPCGNNKTVK